MKQKITIFRTIVLMLIIMFAWFSFEDVAMSYFDKFILPISANINFNIFTYILFVLLFLFFIYILIKQSKKLSIQQSSIYILFIAVYCYYRGFKGYVSLPDNYILGYSDALVILLLVYTIVDWLKSYCKKVANYTNRWIVYLRRIINSIATIRRSETNRCATSETNTPQSTPFIVDKPIDKFEDDILDYSSSIKSLKNSICNLSDGRTSFSVGILAPWGKGKTSYMNLLALEFRKDEYNIIINFNPRHSKDSSHIQADFFKQLFSTIQNHQFVSSSEFESYLKAINIISGKKLSSFIGFYALWNRGSEKEKINKIIKCIGCRIIIFIDDFDRLLADEIIEIFKIIDGSGSFNNTVFVTAYDKEHTSRILDSKYSNEQTNFSDKFFNVEIQVPLRPYSIIYAHFEKKLFSKLQLTADEVSIHKATLSRYYRATETSLTTLRDVKRFINQFVSAYVQLKGEVEFGDFFILHLIKYRYPNEYSSLHNKEYVSKNFLKYSNKLTIVDGTKCSSLSLLTILFNEDRETTLRTINNPDAFDIYFHEYIYDQLSIATMENTLSTDLSNAKDIIKEFKPEQKKEYISFLDYKNVLTLKDKDTFERYVDILIYLYTNCIETTISYLKILGLILNKEKIDDAYQYKENGYVCMWLGKLKNHQAFNLVKMFTIGLINKEFDGDIIFELKDMKNLAKEISSTYTANFSGDVFNYEAMYCCIEDIDQTSRVVTLTDDVLGRMATVINEKPEIYLSSFVRLGMISSRNDYNSIACEPYWSKISKTQIDFENLINKYDGKGASLVYNFWELYKNNDFKPLEYQNQGIVDDKIANELTIERGALDKLLTYESAQSSLSIEDYNYIKDNLPAYGKLRNRFNNFNKPAE